MSHEPAHPAPPDPSHDPRAPDAPQDPVVRSAVGKIFKRVVPLFFVMFVANYVDRVNIGFAQDQLRADVGISAAAFGFGAGLFFVAYALFEVPSNMLMERFGAKIWLTRIMITWGLVATAMAFVTSTEMFYALRFLLGVAEAGFFPAVIYYFTRWLPDADRGRATAVFLMGSGTASVIAGPLSGALLEMHGLLGHSGWQWMFFLEGLASVLLGLVVFRFLDNRLEDATWLTAPEKTALAAAIDAEQAARTAARGTAKVSRLRLLTDPQMLLFCWLYFAISLALYAVTFWLPSIVDDIGGLSEFEVGLLVAVPWLCAIAAVYVTGRASDRTGRRRPFLVGALLLGALGTLLATLVSPWFALVALCLAAMGFKTSSPVFWTIPQSYLDARVAAPAIALVNSLGNLGGFVSPTAFGILQDATGSTRGGLIGLSVVGVLAALSVALVRGGGRNDRPRGRRTATGPAPATVAPPPGRGPPIHRRTRRPGCPGSLDRRAVAGLLADGVDLGVGPVVARVVDLVGAARAGLLGGALGLVALFRCRAVAGLLADGVDLGVGPAVARVVDLVGALRPGLRGGARRRLAGGALGGLGLGGGGLGGRCGGGG